MWCLLPGQRPGTDASYWLSGWCPWRWMDRAALALLRDSRNLTSTGGPWGSGLSWAGPTPLASQCLPVIAGGMATSHPLPQAPAGHPSLYCPTRQLALGGSQGKTEGSLSPWKWSQLRSHRREKELSFRKHPFGTEGSHTQSNFQPISRKGGQGRD